MATSRVQQQLFFGVSGSSSNSNSNSSSNSLNTKTTGPHRSPTADGGSSPAVVMHPTINYKEVRALIDRRKKGGGDFLLSKGSRGVLNVTFQSRISCH